MGKRDDLANLPSPGTQAMTRAEFQRLVKEGGLTLLFHNAETNVITAAAGKTGVQITLRPDLIWNGKTYVKKDEPR